MKISSVTLLWLLLGAFLMLNAADSRLTIKTVPPGLTIQIDSVTIGQSPILNYSIRPGEHLIEALTPEEGLWNAQNIQQKVFLKPGRDTTLFLKMPRRITINSVPYHAKVRVGEELLGRTPLEIDFNEWVTARLTVEKEGYESQSISLQQPRSLLVVLSPIQDEEAVPKAFWHQNLFRKRTKRKVLLLSGSLVSHWLAFYLKNKADDNYDKYRRASRPEQIQHYWDETRKFDRYADITLGVSYSLLAGLIYTVLTD